MRRQSFCVLGLVLLTAVPVGAQAPAERGPAYLPAVAPALQAPPPPPPAFPAGVTSTFPQQTVWPVVNQQAAPGPIAQASGFAGQNQNTMTSTCCAWDCCETRWLDNLSVFLGINGAKEPVDLGLNANFGYRVAVNWGIPLIEESGLGLQIGTSVNYSNSAIRVLKFVDGTVEHWQNFSTIGIFQRSPIGLNWGIAYDYRFDDYYDRLNTTQWRGQVGWMATQDDEIGVWATWRDRGDHASLVGNLVGDARPLNQLNFFWRHVWPNEIATRAWVGVSENHGRFSLIIPGEPNTPASFAFGADMFVPLTESLAIYGEAHFITPNDSGTVTATLGVAWYPGAARHAARSTFAPYLPVANSTSMPLDLRP